MKTKEIVGFTIAIVICVAIVIGFYKLMTIAYESVEQARIEYNSVSDKEKCLRKARQSYSALESIQGFKICEEIYE